MHDAYTQINRWDLPDYNGEGVLFRHDGSGAQVFHVRNDDSENMFAFAFATHPEDSTGVAHILEHTVLSGSERFPVKDPFLQLLKGSVNTFLNALTYPDKTVYPAASPVPKDLFNMMKVYGDAVFFPLLKPELFRQEGHRIQFREDGRLERTGVVYNEMKGNYSSHDSVAAEKCLQSLFPETIYRNDSGGDPKAIPNLTYEQFVAFHRRYYHPSNARIVVYGDIPSEQYLSFLHDEFLHRFTADVETIRQPAEQPRWDSPRRITTTYPLDGVEDTAHRTSVTVNWLLFPVTETRRLLSLSVLSEILLGHSGSPLAKALIDSGLGQDLSPLYGLETDLHEAVFSAGLRGTDADSMEAIESLIHETLHQLVRDGIPEDIVEGALRRVEFQNRELKGGPNGMRVLRRVLRTWMYGGDPTAALRFNDDIAALRERVESVPEYFERLIDEFLLKNPHRTTVVVQPDTGQSQRERDEVERELEERLARLDDDGRRRIEEESASLAALQETPDDPDDLAKIPFLHLDEIPSEVRRIDCELDDDTDGVTVYRHHEFTNGITYVDIAFDFGALSQREELLLNLLGASLTETGLPDTPFDRLIREINLKTGGISGFVSQQTRYDDLKTVRRLFVVRMKTLDHSLDDALALVTRILTGVDFSDSRRLKQIVDEMHEEMVSALIPSGHYFAGLRAGCGVYGVAALEEQLNGVTQVEHLGEVSNGPFDELAKELEQLLTRLLDPNAMSVNVTADGESIDRVASWLPSLRAALAARRGTTGEAAVGIVPAIIPNRPVAEYLLGSSTVAYVAVAFPGIRYGDDLDAAQDLLAHLLRTGLLWEKIRMRGGAYGAFASSRTTEGIFSFASYRDPHTAETLAAYRDALAQLAGETLPREPLDLAKVSMLGRELRPLSPRDAGYVDFRRRLFDITDERRQAMRDRLRSVEPTAIKGAAERLHGSFNNGKIAVIGGSEGLSELRAADILDGGVTIHELGV